MENPLEIDRSAVAELGRLPLAGFDKGYPPDFRSGTVDELIGMTVSALPTPLMVLSTERVDHNIATMAHYSAEIGAWLAPHAKTTMAPAVLTRQVAAGAWAVTAATIHQTARLRRFGVNRIFLANELIDPIAARWLAEELENHPDFEFYCLVDSPFGLDLLRRFPAGRVKVLVELGHHHGRTGVRSVAELSALAEAVDESPQSLVGIEGYEGLFGDPTVEGDLAGADRYLADLGKAVALVQAQTTGTPGPFLVSAGGSAFFDRVAEHLAGLPDTQLVLRSGCYVTHDAGWYEKVSPLGARGSNGAETGVRLHNAVEVHTTVTSQPEGSLAIADAGKRDLGIDLGLPRVLARIGPDGERSELEPRPIVSALSDQHTHLGQAESIAIGDRLALGISHPCSTFDRWRLIPIIDASDRVVDVAVTFF